MNKIRIIDLLSKIANEEEVPEKIKYKDIIYNWKVTEHGTGYCNEDNHYYKWLARQIYCDEKSVLNDTVEIIEDKEDINIQDIEEITYKGEKIRYGSTKQFTDDVDDYCPAINSILDSVGIKINEIIRAVKHLEKTKEDRNG